ncbi:MAG: adenylate/guanylate cyclase domain-containing protein [Verrucomicrobiota bacterium]|jgi:TolB-like protein/class 3 adenylate cyclase/Flp pilus assembly protein TadD
MSANTEQRRLAAIMFTDMVGYSALAQRDDRLALELLEEHRRLLREVFPRFHGVEIKTIGDAFLVEFGSALEAAQCAIEIQRALAKRNPDVTAERRIELRIGIHIGDVVHREGDLYGDGVNIASRIEALAGAGGICVSMDVERQIRNALEARFEKLGPAELKNIKAPMELFRIVLPWETGPRAEGGARRAANKRPVLALAGAVVVVGAVLGWWLVQRRGGESRPLAGRQTNAAPAFTASGATNLLDQKSVAVLPFVNMSGDPDNEYFSDGVTEEILNALARTPGLRVAARTSAFSFKGKNEPVQKIGEALKVGAVLEGSVRRAGQRLRIAAQLISVADGYHLWSDTYDRKAEDVFAVQSEVAQRVQEVLKLKLLAESGPAALRGGTDNLEAYDLFLRGRYFWNKRTEADLERAIGYFQQAAEKDPKLALAYAGLGSCYAVLPDYAEVAVQEVVPKARAAAHRALELEPRLAEAQAVLAICLDHEGDFAGAEKAFSQALALNPNYATAHHWYARLLDRSGRPERGLAEIRLAQALDPLSPAIQSSVGMALYYNRRYDEALLEEDKALQLSPDSHWAYIWRGLVKIRQKRFSEAIADLEKARALGGRPLSTLLAYCYGATGRTNEARQEIERLKANAAKGLSVSTGIAFVYQGLGDKEQVFAWLERAAESGHERVQRLKYEPLWDDVTADPRYAALLKKHGLDK